MKDRDQDNSFIAEALPTFISEAQEHIAQFEQLLLQLEDDPTQRSLLDALFRCAHTIKGSAGIFGLDDIVRFTHHVETLLDELRDGRQTLTPDISTLLLLCNDETRDLVANAQSEPAETAETKQARAALVQQLRSVYGDTEAGADQCQPISTPLHVADPTCWDITTAFGVDTFRNGMDPLAVLNYLRGIGTLTNLCCDLNSVPPLETLDPETCHLSFEFDLNATATREQIESAFSFVRDDCTLHLIGPRKPSPAEVISALPETYLLGDILLSAGAITDSELDASLRLQNETADASEKPKLGEILLNNTQLSPEALSAALDKQRIQRENSIKLASGDDRRFIRVQADRLDQVINLLGELVIASAGAAMLARQHGLGSLIEANQQIGALVEDIRNGTLQLRMVPIGESFARYRRVVRDTAAELGKDIALEIVGGETELDKSVVERIADPLMHLVRNALDHGLETPQQRLAAGKPAQGKLTLSACHESGSILICISDDGAGINRQKVLARAWERGLVEQGVTPEDDEILKLIFEPGFSTAESVTNLSGRGVGMDVVRRNIEALRGSITVYSEPGQGSDIQIRLPLTLAIITGFLVSVGASKFIFPLEGVVEVIESRATTMKQDMRGRSVVELRGEVLPVVNLRVLYGLDSPACERCSVVVIQSGTRRYGVMVDQLHGQHQTVIKPLGPLLHSLRGMSGSSILGNGEVALIFDVHSLGQLAEHPPALRNVSSFNPTPHSSLLQGRPS